MIIGLHLFHKLNPLPLLEKRQKCINLLSFFASQLITAHVRSVTCSTCWCSRRSTSWRARWQQRFLEFVSFYLEPTSSFMLDLLYLLSTIMVLDLLNPVVCSVQTPFPQIFRGKWNHYRPRHSFNNYLDRLIDDRASSWLIWWERRLRSVSCESVRHQTISRSTFLSPRTVSVRSPCSVY